MLRYRRKNLIRSGIIGLVLITLVIAIGLQPDRLITMATGVRYQAEFAEAGGLTEGNDVQLSGITIGRVTDVSLGERGAIVSFVLNQRFPLGAKTTAHIRTGSLLGARILTLEPAGDGRMRPGELIPMTRTGSPYSLNEAVGDLTTNMAATDMGALNRSLETLTATLDQVAPQLGPTFDGVARLSRSLNDRSDSLDRLLKNASAVTEVLAQRSQQVNTLILNADDLFAMLVEQRYAVSSLLTHTTVVAESLRGLVSDNQAQLAPTLERMNAVTAMLERNRDSLSKTLPGFRKFQNATSESLANGPFYSAYVPNVIPPQLLQPFLDYAFGFRRGDPNMPRAELPLPRNGIPGGTR